MFQDIPVTYISYHSWIFIFFNNTHFHIKLTWDYHVYIIHKLVTYIYTSILCSIAFGAEEISLGEAAMVDSLTLTTTWE